MGWGKPNCGGALGAVPTGEAPANGRAALRKKLVCHARFIHRLPVLR